MVNPTDLTIIFKVYLVSLLWQVMAWPLISWYFKDLTDRGWAISRVISTLFVSLIIWQLGNFGFIVNTNIWILGVILTTIIISFVIYRKRGLLPKAELVRIAKYVVTEEYLFIVGLFFVSWVRSFSPEIHSLEKFMDFGFINRYLSSSKLPTMDMWFAGNTINYYSFGHFWASILIRTMGVEPAVGYNLVIAVISGLALCLTFSIVSNLVNKGENGKMVGGLLGAFAVSIGGNSHALWYLFSHNFSMKGYWYADATRFIYNTIHEFPGYSFVVSDLHGHLLDLPMVLTFLLIFYYWTRHKGLIEEILMGILMGVMMMTNTWDLPIFGLLLGVYCTLEIITKKMSILSVIKTGLVILLSLIIIALPWMISFDPISSGIGIVKLKSPLWQIFVLWSGGVISILLALVSSKNNTNKKLVLVLGLTAIILIAIPEFIYAKDIYPNHPRANTMFKLTYQAFILMGISLGVAVGQLMSFKRNLFKFFGIFLGLFIFAGGMIFTVEAFPTFYGNFNNYKGLNGEKWLENEMPERYEVIKYLRNNIDDKNMVEAVGDSYTDLNAISVFSGVPTVVGWRVHEWLWRGGYTPVGERDAEVKSFFEDSNNDKTINFIKKYNIGWIVVGKDEIEKYNLNQKKIRKLGTAVLETNGTYLIKVN